MYVFFDIFVVSCSWWFFKLISSFVCVCVFSSLSPKKWNTFLGRQASSASTAQVEEQEEVEIAKGYTMTQFCDKIIDLFLNEKTKSKEWRKYLVFREEWNKYRDSFYTRCRRRADMENDSTMKEKLISLGRRVKKVNYYTAINYSLCV